jgi:hypothetical protein
MLLSLHSLIRWVIVVFGIWTLVNALTGVFGKRPFTASDNRTNLIFMISCDIQLLLGLILYFTGPWFTALKENAQFVMHDTTSRFFAVEHETMMILAWILVHVGRALSKKAPTDIAKHKKSLIFFGIAIVLILVTIPWPFRTGGIQRPWF